MKRIAVTGTTGFVGKRLMEYDKELFELIPLDLRDQNITTIDLTGIDAVVHLAGKAHQMEPIEDKVYFDVNYELTRSLAEQALKQQVKQFVYISSTKVYGDDVKEVLNEQSVCTPSDAYGASKLKAEQYLLSLQSSAFNVAILRPPLVYGPEVKGNMLRLLHLSNKQYPLPFGKTNNKRSMVFLDNLIELINAIINKEASGIFVAGDKEPLPTDMLVQLIRNELGIKNGLISIPLFLRAMVKKIKPGLYTRLFGSFVVDNQMTNQQLNFVPPYSTEYGVSQMAKWFREAKQNNN
jgi:nucleoside-diphosphate-sugar epimerase